MQNRGETSRGVDGDGTKNAAKMASEVPSPVIPPSKTRGDKYEVKSTKPQASKKTELEKGNSKPA